MLHPNFSNKRPHPIVSPAPQTYAKCLLLLFYGERRLGTKSQISSNIILPNKSLKGSLEKAHIATPLHSGSPNCWKQVNLRKQESIDHTQHSLTGWFLSLHAALKTLPASLAVDRAILWYIQFATQKITKICPFPTARLNLPVEGSSPFRIPPWD